MPNLNSTFAKSNLNPGTYKDDQLPGFCLKVTSSGGRTFSVYARVRGEKSPVRVTIGKLGKPWTATTARREAEKYLLEMKQGINPNKVFHEKARQEAEAKAEKKRADDERQITLAVAFDDFLNSRDLKPATSQNYKYVINKHFRHWLQTPLNDVSESMVIARHAEISTEAKGTANTAMRYLRSIYSFALSRYYDEQGNSMIRRNPVLSLSKTRSWNKTKRRQSVIAAHELPGWFTAVLNYGDETIRDFLIMLLLTGLRKEEAGKLEWTDVDLKAKTLIVRDPKNHDDLILPLSDYLYSMLRRRWQSKGDDRYVFPADTVRGHVYDIRTHLSKLHATVEFTPHDLRRTFATFAYQLCTQYEVKKLMNHRNGNDVTGGYIVASAEQLREPMQKITDAILEAGKAKKKAAGVSPLEQPQIKAINH